MTIDKDEYELFPHKLVEDLKFDVEALRKKLSEPSGKTEELILEIESLKDSIHDLNGIFSKALEESKGDEDAGKVLQQIKEKFETVISQNETIARGMVAISDKLENFMQGKTPPPAHPGPAPHPKHNLGTPPAAGPARVAPPPELPNLGGDDLPPAPAAKKKKGLFG